MMRSLCLLIVIAWAGPVLASLSASVDRRSLELGETLILELEYSGDKASREPELGSLGAEFEILSRASSRELSMVNGKARRLRRWQMTLAPRRTGSLTIPSIKVGDDRSGPIFVQVSEPKPPSEEQLKDIYLEAELSRERLYVQQQLLLTLRIVTRVQLADLQLSDLEIPGVLIESLANRQYQKNLGEASYSVIELKFALFPQRAGRFEVPALRMSAVRNLRRTGGFFGQTTGDPVNRLSPIRRFEVSLPPAAAAQPWLPATEVSLDQRWSRRPAEWTQGEPVTRELILQVPGLKGSQLPEIQQPEVEGLRAYPEQPQRDDSVDWDGVTGTLTLRTALVPQRSGELQLPEIVLNWWDVEADQGRRTVIPAQTALVAPQAQAASDAPLSADFSGRDEDKAPAATALWQAVLIAVLCAGNLLFFSLWMGARGRPAPTPKTVPTSGRPEQERQRFHELQKALQQQRWADVRSLLLGWARVHWPQCEIVGLEQIPAPGLRESLAELDAYLYGTADTAPEAGQLLRALKSVRGKPATDSRQPRPSSLYPADRNSAVTDN